MRIALILYLLTMTVFVSGKYCRGDQCATVKSDNTTVSIEILNRSRFGYTIVSFRRNSDETSILDLIVHVGLDRMLYEFVTEDTNGTWSKQESNPYLVTSLPSQLQLPLSNYLSFQAYQINFNISEFSPLVGTNWTMRLRMNAYGGMLPDLDSFVPSWAEDFEFNVTNATGIIIWPLFVSKISPVHPTWFAINLAFYVFCGIACICVYKYQPLKSRGAIPYFALLCQVGMEISNLFNFFPLEWHQIPEFYEFSKYWRIMTYLAGLSTMTFVEALLLGRYLLLMYLNKRKLLYRSEGKVVTMNWYWQALKLSGHVVVTVILTCIFYIIIAGLISLAWMAGDNKYDIFYNMTIVSCAILATIFFFAEFILNWKREIGLWQNLVNIYKDDVLYFKFEVYVLGVGILFPIFILKFIFLIINLEFWHLLTNTIMIYGVLGLQVLFPLSMTIISLIRDSLSERVRDVKGELKTMLFDADGFILLKKFSEHEYSSENLLCFEEIQKYKRISKCDEQTDFVRNFCVLFLDGAQSELELNVSRDVCDFVHQKLKKLEIDRHTLDGVEYAVSQNIKDTFSRFRRVGAYMKYSSEKNLVKEI